MESKTPIPPSTVRRNPPRHAKRTPFPAAATTTSIGELLHSYDPPDGPPTKPPGPSYTPIETLKVFLRVRPLDVEKLPSRRRDHAAAALAAVGKGKAKRKSSPKKPQQKRMNNMCLVVNDSSSISLVAPPSAGDSRRSKSEVYDGFSYVFPSESSQEEVYERVMCPLVMDFIGGKSVLLVAMGPTGSGKTHTMFGSPRDPGIIARALRHIFNPLSEIGDSCPSRSHYLSMFEINSERGKGEKIIDLLPNGADVSLHQSTIMGLQEVLVSNVKEAEALLACGALKRATAMTNANNQSSRSQCIITIRNSLKSDNEGHGVVQGSTLLTIADLAGAERERKTGNQGLRLLESSFINNTSMVFGQCLRSLLEHQRNPKKPLQKHFKNSMLTRYLKDYMEGKRQMTLILTVKPGEEDYLDTSFLLRQASPYMKIRFNHVEDVSNLTHPKRSGTCARIQHSKRRKFNDNHGPLNDSAEDDQDDCPSHRKGISLEKNKKYEGPHIQKKMVKVCKVQPLTEDEQVEFLREASNEETILNFAKAIWKVLKHQKQKLLASEKEVQRLEEILRKKADYVMELENKLKKIGSSTSCLKHCHVIAASRTEDHVLSNCTAVEVVISPPVQISKEEDEGKFTHDDRSPLLQLQLDSGSGAKGIPRAMDGGDKRDETSTAASSAVDDRSTFSLSREYQILMKDGKLEASAATESDVFVTTLLTQDHTSDPDFNFLTADDEGSRETQGLLDTTIQHCYNGEVVQTVLFPPTDPSMLPEEKLETSAATESDVCVTTLATQDHEASSLLDTTIQRSCNGEIIQSVPSLPIDPSMLPEEKALNEEYKIPGGNCRNGTEFIVHKSLDITHLTDSLAQASLSISQKDEDSTLLMPRKQEAILVEHVEQNSSAHPSKVSQEKESCQVEPAKKEEDASISAYMKKPKRKLLPASAMLLKEFNGIDVEAEPKENRARSNMNSKGRSEGSMSLLRLLRNNFQHQKS